MMKDATLVTLPCLDVVHDNSDDLIEVASKK